MRRFINSHYYGSQYWAAEFKNEYLQILSKCAYSKGSLMQFILETALEESRHVVKAIRPVIEATFSPLEKASLRQNFMSRFPGEVFEVKRCGALGLGTFTNGSASSKYNLIAGHGEARFKASTCSHSLLCRVCNSAFF